MAPINIMKINIVLNVAKIIVGIVAISTFSVKSGMVAEKIMNKFNDYDKAVVDVQELKKWRDEVTAYYLTNQKKITLNNINSNSKFKSE